VRLPPSAEAALFGPLPPEGWHAAEVQAVRAETSAGDQRAWRWTFDVPGARPLLYVTPVGADRLEKLADLLEALDVTAPFDTAELAGRRLRVHVQHVFWNGELRARIDGVQAARP